MSTESPVTLPASVEDAIKYLESINAPITEDRILWARFLATNPTVEQVHVASSLVVEDRSRRTTSVDAAEICAEMAREADRCATDWKLENEKYGGAGPEVEKFTRYSAMADALREAERRIRALGIES